MAAHLNTAWLRLRKFLFPPDDEAKLFSRMIGTFEYHVLRREVVGSLHARRRRYFPEFVGVGLNQVTEVEAYAGGDLEIGTDFIRVDTMIRDCLDRCGALGLGLVHLTSILANPDLPGVEPQQILNLYVESSAELKAELDAVLINLRLLQEQWEDLQEQLAVLKSDYFFQRGLVFGGCCFFVLSVTKFIVFLMFLKRCEELMKDMMDKFAKFFLMTFLWNKTGKRIWDMFG